VTIAKLSRVVTDPLEGREQVDAVPPATNVTPAAIRMPKRRRLAVAERTHPRP
jgi:hypothetical protein